MHEGRGKFKETLTALLSGTDQTHIFRLLFFVIQKTKKRDGWLSSLQPTTTLPSGRGEGQAQYTILLILPKICLVLQYITLEKKEV